MSPFFIDLGTLKGSFMLQYWYIFFGLAAVIYVWRKDLRREMLWAGFFTLPVFLFEPLLAASGDVLVLGSWPEFAARVVLAFSIGALASVIYEVLFRRTLSPQRHPARGKLGWLVMGAAVSAALILGFHQPYIRSLAIGLLADVVLIIVIRHDLLWDVIVSGSGLAMLYTIIFLFSASTATGSVTSVFSSQLTSGLTINALPIEEVVAVFLFGALWGPIYAATKHYNETPPKDFFRLSLHPKMLLSTLLIVLGLGVAAWSLNQFFLAPVVEAVTPEPSQGSIGLTEPITIHFARPVDRNRLTLSISPDVNGHWTFSQPTLGSHAFQAVTFNPDPAWRPGTDYMVRVEGVQSLFGTKSQPVAYQFVTTSLPTVVGTSLNVARQDPCASFTATLNSPNDGIADFAWMLTPQATVSATVSADKQSYRIAPVGCLASGTSYVLLVDRTVQPIADQSATNTASQPITIFSQAFTTSGTASAKAPAPAPLTIREVSPRLSATGVGVTTPIKISFSQAVNQAAAQSAFSITPTVAGKFSWDGNTMSFQPNAPLAFDTSYSIIERAGVPAGKLQLAADYSWQFSTVVPTTILNVSVDYQDKPLSSEAAALKMAFAAKGLHVTEDMIMDQVGYDQTPHLGSIWGDPNQAFVGNIYGRQLSTGYGVHWQPIARAASHWRSATPFSAWTAAELAGEIAKGNPVIIWGTTGAAYPETWRTPAGQQVQAWKGEIARTVIGFTGLATHPKTFIVNDPQAGRVTWSMTMLLKNWSAFGFSGVVVR